MMSEDDIHTPDNFELSAKLSNNNLNTALFRNERLQRIKPRQKLSEPLHVVSQEDWYPHPAKSQTKTKAGTGSQADGSHQHTVYQSHFRGSMAQSRQKRVYTSNPGGRRVRKRDQLHRQSTTQYDGFMQAEPSAPQGLERKNVYTLLERKNNKGSKLQAKNMENWLNDILVEYCYKQKFDMTIKHPALKKFMIDRNCLLSKGLSHEQIDRIYRSLFVYSIGFNKLLEELSSSREAQPIRKTLWRVYANLLEYCAKGEFETMLVNIQHDRDEDVKKMREEIAKRQELIDNIDRANREKNEKVVKKLEQLEQSNANLKQERDYIEEDLKQVDQAFNQEVSLRLKFEHKINEIHGVHRELEMKHIRLLDDFSNYKKDFARVQQEKLAEQERVERLMFSNQELQARIDNLKLELQDRTTRMETLEYNLNGQTQKALLLESKIEDASSEDNHRERQVALLKFEVDNLRGMVQHRLRAQEEQKRQIGVLVQENRGMYNKIDQQKLRIRVLMQEESNFSQSTLNLKTRLQNMESKFQEKAREHDELASIHNIIQDKLSAAENELELSSEKNRLLQSDIDNFIVSIRAMKKAKGDIEDDLNQLRKQNKTMLEIIKGSETSMASLTNKLAETTEELTRIKSALLDAEAQLKFKEDSFNREKTKLTKENEKLKVEREELLSIDKKRGQQLKQMEIETEKSKKEFEKAEADLRDEKFERDNLQLQFKTSLMEVVGEKEVIKKLNIDISRMEQERDDVARHLKAKEFALLKLNETYNQEVAMLNRVVEQQRTQLQSKRMYVHPMHYHEVYSRLVRQNNLYQGSQLAYETLKDQIKLMEENTHKHYKLSIEQLEERKKEQLEQKDKLLFSKEKEIEHIREKIQTTASRIQQLETSLRTYEMAGTKEDPRIQELERVIKEKEAKIEQAIVQNKGLQQRNSELNTNVILRENEVKEQKKQLEERVQELRSIQSAREEEKKQFMKVQEALIKQLSEQQQSYKALLSELNDVKEVLPEKRPSLEGSINDSSVKRYTEQSQSQQEGPHTHQKSGSNSSQKVKDGKKNFANSKNELATSKSKRQDSGDKGNVKEGTRKSEKSQPHVPSQQEAARVAKEHEEDKQRRRVADMSRRDIVRKLQGATNYYSGAHH